MTYLFDGISLLNGRDTNMDCLLLTSRQINGTSSLLAVVCDGVGSMAYGAYASSESVRMLHEWYSGLADTQRAGLRIRDEVLSINSRIIDAAINREFQTATTLSALLLIGRQYYIVHAGDSRVYAVGCDRLLPMTIDHLTKSGDLSVAIGRRDNPELYYAEGVADSDIFLLCSDGLHNRVAEDLIYRSINVRNKKALRKTLNELSSIAITQGERDNITIAIVKIMGGVQ